jgi:hypothetical protein
MSIEILSGALENIIQQNYLQREFQDGLESVIAYRRIADKMTFEGQIGQTLTMTRKGLKSPVPTPLNPTTNTNLDNGLTPSDWTIEQYTMGLNMYGDTIDLNVVTDRVNLATRFLANARTNGVQASQTRDRIARDALFNAYMSGNTRVTATLGAPGPTISVDDVRGFLTVIQNGVMTPVSGSATMPVIVNGNVYTLQSYTIDSSSTSTAPNGASGTLTFTTNVTVPDGTLGNYVVGAYAPTILRPNNRATTAALQATDTLTMSLALDAVAQLRDNAVPTVDGFYHCYLDNVAARELFADPDFKELFRGRPDLPEFKEALVAELLDIRFIATTEAYIQTGGLSGGITCHRPIVCGAGALIEGNFANPVGVFTEKNAIVDVSDNVVQVTRAALDRLQQIIAQSWYWIGGYAVPTDQTAGQNIIPTANDSYFKRAIVLEVA